MQTVKGAIVLITGAAMGMGKLYARRAVDEGATVVLWDVNAELLAATAAELGPAAHPYVVDISSADAIARAAELVRAEVGDPSILINNAGIVRGKLFVEHDHEADIELTIEDQRDCADARDPRVPARDDREPRAVAHREHRLGRGPPVDAADRASTARRSGRSWAGATR